MAAYLQVDLEDPVKLVLRHAEQEVVLRDARCVHAQRGRLEVVRLQGERRTRPSAAARRFRLQIQTPTLRLDHAPESR